MATVYELADQRSVGRAENGAARATRTFRLDGGVTEHPPENVPGIPRMNEPHPRIVDAVVRGIDWQPVPAFGWECVVTYSNVTSGTLGPIIPEQADIGKYHYGLGYAESSARMPIARLARKTISINGVDTVIPHYETIIFDIPQGSMTFVVDVIDWAPDYAAVSDTLSQVTRIHQFGGGNGKKFRFLGGETQYLGSRGEGTDPIMRDVCRYVYRWVHDTGTTIINPQGAGEAGSPLLVTPRGSQGGNPLLTPLDRPPFQQWVVIPREVATEPPDFELLAPYDESTLLGWRTLPGMGRTDLE